MIAAEEATDTRLLLGPVRARVGGLDWQVAGTQWETCAACVRLRHLRAGVAGLRGAGPAAAGGLAPLRRGGEMRPRVHLVRGHQGQQRQCHHQTSDKKKYYYYKI